LEERHRWFVRNFHFLLSVYVASCYGTGYRRTDRSLQKHSVFTCAWEGEYEQLRPACYRLQWCIKFRVLRFVCRITWHATWRKSDVFDGRLSGGLQSRAPW